MGDGHVIHVSFFIKGRKMKTVAWAGCEEGRTVGWRNCKVVLLDQNALPHKEVFIETSDYLRVAEAIKTLSVRGAPAIGVAAAYGLALAGLQSNAKGTPEFLQEIDHAAGVLGSTRPTAINLFWALDRMKKTAHGNSHLAVSRMKRILKEEADDIADEELEMSRRMGQFGADLLKSGDTVLTH